MNDEYQSMAANGIIHAADRASQACEQAAWDTCAAASRPSVLYRPAIYMDGNQWCALYGDNLQDGVCGFGDSPAAAMQDFDMAWVTP